MADDVEIFELDPHTQRVAEPTLATGIHVGVIWRDDEDEPESFIHLTINRDCENISLALPLGLATTLAERLPRIIRTAKQRGKQ